MPTDPDDEPRAANDAVDDDAAGDAAGGINARGRAGVWARAVPLAFGMVVLVWVTKIVAVLVALVGPGVLGDQIADRPGAMIGITVGALVILAVGYVAVTRTGDGAYVVHEICAEAMIWIAAGWAIAMGWLVGDTVSDAGALVGLLAAAVVVGVAGLAVARKLNGGLVKTLRRGAAN